jgi:nitroreductase
LKVDKEGVRSDLKPERRPTRPYPDIPANEWGIWKVLYARRSNRKYSRLSGPLPEEGLERATGSALAARGAAGGSVFAVTEPSVVDAVRRGCYKGFSNKINLWLARSPVSGFLVLALPREDVDAERPLALPLAAMAAEDCVLWLTERGLGTCWLGGLNQGEVAGAAGLDRSTSVPAVICFGEPKRGGAASYDRLTSRTLSRSRKTLAEIACSEEAGTPLGVGGVAPGGFRVVERQDVESLLSRIVSGEAGEGSAPVDFVVESSLEAARMAPSGGNSQRWRFVVVSDEERLGDLAALCSPEKAWMAAVVAAGETRRIEAMVFDKPFWMLDVPIAISHITLTAVSMGYGAEIRTAMDEGAVNRLVSLPSGERTVGVIGIY